MSWFLYLALGICLIIFVGGVVNWVNLYLEKQPNRQRKEEERLEERLAEIERRLTEVQDVMIALSEKFDRWEQERVDRHS